MTFMKALLKDEDDPEALIRFWKQAEF
jgi:hypothetical protein